MRPLGCARRVAWTSLPGRLMEAFHISRHDVHAYFSLYDSRLCNWQGATRGNQLFGVSVNCVPDGAKFPY